MLIGLRLNLDKESFFFKFKTLLLPSTSKSTPSFKWCLKHFLKAGFLKTCCDELDQFVHNGKVNQITKFFDKSIIKIRNLSSQGASFLSENIADTPV